MAEKKTKGDSTLTSEMKLLDSLLNPETRLAKKYLMDAEGKLRLYHPVVQRGIWALLTGEDFSLRAELEAYHKEKKCKEKNPDCTSEG